MYHSFKNVVTYGKSLLQPGIQSEHPLIIFESDDWGCIRMPSKKTKENINSLNPEWVNDPYLQFDSIESKEDLEALFNLLSRHKDVDGNHPVLTANCIGMNPDFERIREHNFSTYFYEDFRNTFLQDSKSEQSLQVELDAMNQGLFVPQFHGREHIQVSRWMSALRNNNELLNIAFNNKLISLKDNTRHNCIGYYMDAMNPVSESNMIEIVQITLEGLQQFKKVWGMDSVSMIAPCYLWHNDLEQHCGKLGIRVFQGIKYQLSSRYSGNPDDYSKIYHYPGEKQNGMYYNIRNAFFEPSLNPGKDWVATCLKDIEKAINHYGFATVSVHRLNFIGSIEATNRSRGLKLFDELLKRIKALFPSVKFISTPELLTYWTSEADAAA